MSEHQRRKEEIAQLKRLSLEQCKPTEYLSLTCKYKSDKPDGFVFTFVEGEIDIHEFMSELRNQCGVLERKVLESGTSMDYFLETVQMQLDHIVLQEIWSKLFNSVEPPPVGAAYEITQDNVQVISTFFKCVHLLESNGGLVADDHNGIFATLK